MEAYYVRQKALIAMRRLLNQARMREKKVFAVGFNKSGTTSLHALFESLGLPSYHGEEWRGCDDLPLLYSYDCFSDGIPADLAKLDSLFPGSKFILQVRDLESWVYSRLAHIEREKKRNAFRGDPEWNNTEYAVKAWLRKRNNHHLFVLSYFSERPSDILVVNFIRDKLAATKVCNFLGYKSRCERPKKNVNSNRARPLRHKELLSKCIAELEIPEHELKYDIYCPSLVNSESPAEFPADSSMLEATQPQSQVGRAEADLRWEP